MHTLQKILYALALLFHVTSTTSAKAETKLGIVTFTFDDATALEWNGYLALDAKGLPGTMFVTTSNAGTSWGLSWDQIREMASRGWEIAAHSDLHPDMTQINDTELQRELSYPKQKIADEVGVVPTSFASPFGRYDERVLREASKLYSLHVTAWGNNPAEEGWNAFGYIDPMRISRVDVGSPTTNPDDVCNKVRRAAAEKRWLVLLFHTVTTQKPEAYQIHLNVFEKIVECVTTEVTRGTIAVATLKDGYTIAKQSPK
jgi:peptidoglycan/xylan/chitin deacetylase (PgdA/CDA1 family)